MKKNNFRSRRAKRAKSGGGGRICDQRESSLSEIASYFFPATEL
jgi:hypothetical protein